MNVVLDTNIVIGAAITPKGPPGRIIEAWRASAFVLIVSPPMLVEIQRAFEYPRVKRYLAWNGTQVAEFLQLLLQTAILVEPGEALEVVSDTDDNRILEAAVAGDAEYLVTNDDALLQLKTYDGIEIVTAARFTSILASL
ncbi:MAG TPA: putative toxin-antitoxin system toxin component, PIN family [Dehalococcoidia bacterium]|jgi:putative PIN family toxin of toxin-antitoxin system